MENVRPQAAGWGHLKCGFLSQHSLKTLPQKSAAGTFLVVHWLRLCLAMWGDAGLIPVGELRFLMPRSNGFHVQQLLSWSATTRVCALQGKISRDTTKTWHSKKKKILKSVAVSWWLNVMSSQSSPYTLFVTQNCWPPPGFPGVLPEVVQTGKRWEGELEPKLGNYAQKPNVY